MFLTTIGEEIKPFIESFSTIKSVFRFVTKKKHIHIFRQSGWWTVLAKCNGKKEKSEGG